MLHKKSAVEGDGGMQITLAQLNCARGIVIQRFVVLEGLVNGLMCARYVGWDTPESARFSREVLEDENFNFGMKVLLLQKHFGLGKQIDDIRRLMSWRNYFAHGGLNASVIDGHVHIPDSKRPGKTVDLSQVYSDFETVIPEVCIGLIEALYGLGRQLQDLNDKALVKEEAKGLVREILKRESHSLGPQINIVVQTDPKREEPGAR